MKIFSSPCKRVGALTPGWSSRLLGLWLCLQREQLRGAFRNACLTNILLTFADSLLHCLFFLVPWMCWFLSLLLGLCPRHCIISVFVFGSCVGGRYLYLDTNVNIIHAQVNNSNEKQGSEDCLAWGGRVGTLCSWAGPSPASLPGISHHHLHLVLLSLQALLPQLFWTMNLNSESQNILSWNGTLKDHQVSESTFYMGSVHG